MRGIAIVFLIIFSLYNGFDAVTEKQLQAAGKLLRNRCQPKSKVTDEQIENMHKGVWDDEKTTMCYANCLLSMYKLVDKSGKFDNEYAEQNIDQLPKPRQAPTRASAKKCLGSDNHDDKCAASYFFLKCFYFDNPDNYFAP